MDSAYKLLAICGEGWDTRNIKQRTDPEEGGGSKG